MRERGRGRERKKRERVREREKIVRYKINRKREMSGVKER